MLIMPPGHTRDLAKRRQFTRGERRFLALGGGLVVAVVIAVIVAIGSSSPTSGHGCIYMTLASSTGAVPLDGCGKVARRICDEAYAPGVYAPAIQGQIAAECRKAGLPVPRRS